MNRQAFTLIELMTALIVLGFIVSVLFAALANPVAAARTEAAATQLLRDLGEISSGLQAMAAASQREPVIVDSTSSHPLSALPSGLPGLTVVPAPGPDGLVAAETSYHYHDSATAGDYPLDDWGDSDDDGYIFARSVGPELCLEVDRQTGVATATPVQTTPSPSRGAQCVDLSGNGSTTGYYVVMPVFVH